jgi:hypothetical protein
VAAKTGREIPFTARVEQTLNEALRYRQAVAPDEFPVRMLRDVTVSPDGKVVVYSALGRLYRKALPGGEPVKITADASSPEAQWLEMDPAFSTDGRSIVYAAWNDAELGRIRVASADGSGVRDAVSAPGHYVTPRFSPDGQRIVFRAARADGVRGITHAQETGLYVVPAAGGEPAKLRDGGVDPQFDHTGERIYFRDRRGEKFVLASVTLDGGDEIVHFQSDNATQIVPSPDGKWVAFAERYKAYVAAFPRTGRTVDLGPNVKGYPVSQISRDAGMYLHWSGDNQRVQWALGPELFTRELGRTFAFLSAGGAGEKPAEPESKGVPIGFTTRSDTPSGTIALVGARIVTMAEARGQRSEAGGAIENGTIVIEGNRIAAVGPSGSVTVPAGAQRIDVQGKTIIPGLIDVHAHVGTESDGLVAQNALAAARQPGVRRDALARPVRRHRDDLHQRGDDPRGAEDRAAPLLDRDDPLRRRDAVQGGRRDL